MGALMAKLVRGVKALGSKLLRGTNGLGNPSATNHNSGNVEASPLGNPCIGRCGGEIVDNARGFGSVSMEQSVGENGRSSNQEVSPHLPSDGGHVGIVSIKLPSPLEGEDPFMQWYEVQSKKVNQILARGEGQMLNAKMCKHMIKKLQEVVDLTLKMIHASGRVEKFNCILKDLYRVAMKAFALVEDCGGEDLLVGVAYQLESEESFQELLLEFECVYNATCGLCQKLKPMEKIIALNFGSASCEDVELDRATLKRLLKNVEIAPETSDESSKLRKYLFQRLEDLENVKGGELNTLEFANCGTFEKGKQLGATGGCGLVYESKWLGMTCATKMLNNCKGDCDEKTKATFCNEARILAGLNHPNLVKFMGMGVGNDGWPFLMMEKMDKSVASLMHEYNTRAGYGLPFDVAIDIILQVASGMYYLHDMHVAHRDLKPDNVLWTTLYEGGECHSSFGGFGSVKLTDFGISKIEVGNESLKADNMGTNFYRAPETLRMYGDTKGSYFQADVYSFGIMCAALLHGEVEFEQPYQPSKDFYEKIEGGMCPELPSNCEELNTLIRQCCAFHPFERPTFADVWKRVMCLKANYLMGELYLPTCSIDKVNEVMQREVHLKLYGVDEKVKEVQACLEGANSLGIVGMGGVGKSTLAQAILDAEEGNQKFKRRCLHHIGRLVSDDDCLQVLQNLLEKLGVKKKVDELMHGRKELEKVLKESNIFLILDDVWNQSHLNNILAQGNLSLYRNSIVIVCSRNWDVIKDHVGKKYDMQPLSNNEMCMKLFTTHCFDDEKDGIPKELYEVGKQIVGACKGLPLSLKVLGAFLRGKERSRSWTRVLQRLKRGRSPQSGEDWRIFEVLKISFDGLEELEKRIFLDICCFFLQDVYGERLSVDEDCSKLLTHGESALMKAFEMLIHRSLVEVDSRTLQMHDQLRDMGRKIVEWNVHAKHSGTTGEAKYVGTRLQHPSSSALEQMTKEEFDFGKIEGISCELLRDDAFLEKHFMEGVCPKLRILLIQTDLEEVIFNFTQLTRLTTFELCGAQIKRLPNGLESLIHVRSLKLKSCAKLKFLPRGLAHMTSLTSLDLSGCSNLAEVPKELGNLSSLTSINLKGCSNLVEVPTELGNLSSLTSLYLSGCSNLVEVPKELGNLSCLTSLNLSWCSKLLAIPKELGNLSSLTSLNLWGCSKLLAIPKELGNLSSLTSLHLSGYSNLVEVPKELGNLSSLTSLHLSRCSKLLAIPKELENLSSLTLLNLSWCSKLLAIPKELGNLSSLTSLNLWSCSNLVEVPKELGNLSSLTLLNLSWCSNLAEVPKELGNLSSLTSLDLSGCSNLVEVPKELGNLSSLTSLDLSGCSILAEVPKEFGNLSSLTSLNLWSCSNLVEVPKELGNLSSLTSLDLSGCSNLVEVPKELGNLSSLTSLDLSGCSILAEVPKEFGNLSSLTSLNLWSCSNLVEVPKELGNLSSLTSLSLSGCSNLTEVPKELGNLSSLTLLNLSWCSKLLAIPKELGNLSSLTSLHLSGCSKLLAIPKELGNLSSLTSLHLSGCSNLVEVPKELGNLSSLTSLHLSGCSNLAAVSKELGNLSSLTSLHLSRCSKLLAIPKELGNLSSLTSLDLSRCSNLAEVPKELGNLSSLTSLHLSRCSKLLALPKELGNLSSLTLLSLSRCSNLAEVLKELGNLSSLTSLHLSRCSKLLALPKELGNLSSLTLLSLSRCSNLAEVPKELGNLSSLTSLHLSRCSKLLAIPKELGNLSSLTSLDLSGCSNLVEVPKELGNLSSLTSLHLSRCSKLLAIPKELGNLSSLTSLHLSRCSKLLALPKELGNLSSLTSLSLSRCSNLAEVPKELGNLSSLTSLHLSRCSKLLAIPKELGNLSSLTSLDLSGCSNLVEVPKELGNFSSLTSLDLSGCSNLAEVPKELGNLSSVTTFDLSGCSNLLAIPKELGNLSSLTSLDLSGCSKLSVVPKELEHLACLDIT